MHRFCFSWSSQSEYLVRGKRGGKVFSEGSSIRQNVDTITICSKSADKGSKAAITVDCRAHR